MDIPICGPPKSLTLTHTSMAMTQEPIDWRYLPYIRPIFQNITTKYGLKYATVAPLKWILKIPLIIRDTIFMIYYYYYIYSVI